MTISRRAADAKGYLPLILPLMLGLAAVTVLLSGRDLARMFQDLAMGGGMEIHPAVAWLQRAVSIVLLLIAGERLLNHAVMRRPIPSPWLLWAFVVYWLGTVAAPSFLGAHRQVSHEYAYTLVIGLAGLVATDREGDRVVDAARTALFLFIVASFAMAAVNPGMVLDFKYTQGLLPGVPRFGGLASHPVAMGMFAQTFLLCLWVHPFRRKWLTWFGWAIGLAALFLAQSKTSWIAFFLCGIAMLAVRRAGDWWRRIGDPRQGSSFGIVACLGVIVAVSAVVGVLLFADLGDQASNFVNTDEGAQLMSMTGRDQIWAVAMEEWHQSPVFGYGPGLWDDAFRASINMPNATNAHNQFMDTLARSGVVGATALVLYGAVLMVLSILYAKRTGGFSLALFIALALRAVSEVPLLLFGYGTEMFTHLLLLITLASAASETIEVKAAAAKPARRGNWRTAS
jgi:O-antigen ligase